MKLIIALFFLAIGSASAAPPTAAEMGMMDDEHANMHKLPSGTGAAPDGGAWLVPEVSGAYILHTGTILGVTTNAVHLEAGKPYRVMPHKGPLIWTTPAGVREQVPNRLLIPPGSAIPRAADRKN